MNNKFMESINKEPQENPDITRLRIIQGQLKKSFAVNSVEDLIRRVEAGETSASVALEMANNLLEAQEKK